MNDLTRYSGGAVARMNRAEIARVDRAIELVVHKIRAVSYAGEFAITRAVIVQLAQKAAEEIAPNGAESYAAIAQETTAGVLGLLAELRYRL